MFASTGPLASTGSHHRHTPSLTDSQISSILGAGTDPPAQAKEFEKWVSRTVRPHLVSMYQNEFYWALPPSVSPRMDINQLPKLVLWTGGLEGKRSFQGFKSPNHQFKQ